MKERFNVFMSQLSETNSTLDSLTDFAKVSANVNKLSMKLCQLNHLLGRKDLKVAVGEIFQENPNSFSVLGMLVAVREGKLVLDGVGAPVKIESYFESVEDIFEFLTKTGLHEVFTSRRVTNLVDYVFGVEVGLDTNARKNRGGTIMENLISRALLDAEIEFRSQVSSSEFTEIESLGEDIKRFDFVVKTSRKTYLIEANFYNSGGSKLNETARAYSDIAPKINRYENFEFVWITDGKGWYSAKNKLEEAFSIVGSMYNLTTLPEFITKLKSE